MEADTETTEADMADTADMAEDMADSLGDYLINQRYRKDPESMNSRSQILRRRLLRQEVKLLIGNSHLCLLAEIIKKLKQSMTRRDLKTKCDLMLSM